MTQLSWPWTCSTTGDGGTASFTMDVVQFTSMILLNADPTTAGVVYWEGTTPLSTISTVSPFNTMTGTVDGLLLPSNPSGNTVRIASGLGLVAGWLYANDGNVDFDVSGGAADATDIIVLRRDRTAETVRLALVRGPAAGTATVTQTSATWEVKLCDVLLDGSGNFSALTDARHFCLSPMAGMVKIRQFVGDGTTGTITWNNLQQNFSSLLVIGVWRSDHASTADTVALQFNNEMAGSNYNEFEYSFQDATAFGNPAYAQTSEFTMNADAANAQATTFSYVRTEIINYSDNSNYSTIRTVDIIEGGAGANLPQDHVNEGWWSNTDAITRIDYTLTNGNFVAGTKLTLYGLR